MKMIFAMGKNNGVVGNDNNLPWHIKEDMDWFKSHTLNNVVIMGRKTFESMKCKPLPNRRNFVITTDTTYDKCDIITMHDITSDHLKEHFKTKGMEMFIIGGKTIYEQTVDLCDEIIITYVSRKDGKDIDGDTFLDKDFAKTHNLKLVSCVKCNANKEYDLEFCTYVHNK